MDYSKLTPEQLLELLKTQSPEMYSALTTPVYADWLNSESEGVDPMADHLDYRNDLKDTIGRGYDPNLIVEDAHKQPLFELNPTDEILYQLSNAAPGSDSYLGSFPSDNIDISTIKNYKQLPPAYLSAQIFNGMSDEDLLNLLPKDDSPLFDFNIYDLVDDYEGNAEAVDRHLKRNKNFRWD